MLTAPQFISTEALRLRIEDGLKKISFGNEPKELYAPIRYMIGLGGKRLRPSALLMACDLFGGDTEKAMPAALAIEVFHNFTLIHDDIMDNAPVRRNRPSVHVKWNTSIAILAGDVMSVWAYRLLSQCDSGYLPEVLNIFNETSVKVCEGQQLDMNFQTRDNVSIDEYIRMTGLKTATLLAGSLKMGSVLGGAQQGEVEKMYRFGYNLGIAFQLQDDLLDVFADPDKFGKVNGGDIVAGKKTYLLLKAVEMADKKTRNELKRLIDDSGKGANERVSGVKAIYEMLGIRSQVKTIILEYYDRAMIDLDAIQIAPEKKKPIFRFVDNLIAREL